MSLEQWTCWPKITPSLSYHIPFSCSTLGSSPLPASPLSLNHLTLSAAVTWTCTPLSHYSFLITDNCSWNDMTSVVFLLTFSPLKKITRRRFWPSLLISLMPERQAQPLPQSWQRKSEGWGPRMSPIWLGAFFPLCRKTGAVMCIHGAFHEPCIVCVYWGFSNIWAIQTLSKCLLCKMDTKKCSRLWKEKWLFVFLCWMKRGQKSFCSSTKEPIKQKQNTRVPRVQQQGGSALGFAVCYHMTTLSWSQGIFCSLHVGRLCFEAEKE